MEKPATITSAQCAELLRLAKTHERFFMEATWTRFFPLVRSMASAVHSGEIGHPHTLWADFSDPKYPPPARIWDRDQAGGGWMEAGTYLLMFALVLLYLHPSNERVPPVVAAASMTFRSAPGFDPAGTDESVVAILQFPKLGARAILSVNLAVAGDRGLTLQGSTGQIIMKDRCIGRPESYVVRTMLDEKPRYEFETRDEERKFELKGRGSVMCPYRHIVRKGSQANNHLTSNHTPLSFSMGMEADACARCIRDGQLECDVVRWEDSLLSMKVGVLVQQGDVCLPSQSTLTNNDDSPFFIFIFFYFYLYFFLVSSWIFVHRSWKKCWRKRASCSPTKSSRCKNVRMQECKNVRPPTAPRQTEIGTTVCDPHHDFAQIVCEARPFDLARVPLRCARFERTMPCLNLARDLARCSDPGVRPVTTHIQLKPARPKR